MIEFLSTMLAVSCSAVILLSIPAWLAERRLHKLLTKISDREICEYEYRQSISD